MSPISPLRLGATLYMPATRDDITNVILHDKITDLRSLVVCLEDAVADHEIHIAFKNLITISEKLATTRDRQTKPLVFIRPRNLDMAQTIIKTINLQGIDGFVLPKFNRTSLSAWEDITLHTDLLWMPTLETQEVFDAIEMQHLATALENSPACPRIVALRIGGNDLMSVLGIRRARNSTIYDGPLGYVIKMLSCTFGARGFSLTSPVCELIDQPELLKQELEQDKIHGMVGKTAIHPSQIPLIQQHWMVDPTEYEDAVRIINSSQAVYKHAGAMCEPATHRKWAENVLERRKYYGLSKPVLSTRRYQDR